jgi:hypothetical protein
MVTDPTDLRRLAADDELDAICGKLLLDTSYEGYAGRKAAHATIALRKRVAELEGAARAFDECLSSDCDGPERDALRAALGGSQ